MQGYQVNFYTLQNRKHQHQPISEWLVDKAQMMGIRGATVLHGDESFGSDGRIHAARFFEQTEQPIIVVMVMTETQCDQFFELIRSSELRVFFTRTPVEFGYTIG
jgi:PII-like signaling protein